MDTTPSGLGLNRLLRGECPVERHLHGALDGCLLVELPQKGGALVGGGQDRRPEGCGLSQGLQLVELPFFDATALHQVEDDAPAYAALVAQ